MTDLSYFFKPLAAENFEVELSARPQSLGSVADIYFNQFPDWPQADIVLLGCREDRASMDLRGSAQAPDRIREYLYRLAAPLPTMKIADLGNLVYRDELDEVYNALGYVMGELYKAGKTVILLGGSQDVAYGQYQGYQSLEMNVEYVSIDSQPDMIDAEIALTNHSFNSQIFMHTPNYLFHYCCLGAQSYYITENERKVLKAMHFELIRVADLHGNIRRAEPALRQADMVSFDMAAIRQSDAPGTSHPSPAGLTSEEACQLARYAGMGYKTSSFSITEMNPAQDPNGQTAHLGALLAWFFIEGFYNRMQDVPRADRSNLQRYTAALSGPIPEIVFFRSEPTDRWWMEVPSPQALRAKGISVLAPCTHEDYVAALRGDIPERWWTVHYRFQ